MANTSAAPSAYAHPEYQGPVQAGKPAVWWPLVALVVLVLLFDPLNAMTPQAVFAIAGVAAIVLATSLVVRNNQPMRLGAFDGAFFLLLFYMAFNLLARMMTRDTGAIVAVGEANTDAVLRFLRLGSQMCVLYAVFGICRARSVLAGQCLQLLWWITIASCIFALLQCVGQQTGAFDLFFEYQSFRTREIWQVTAQFDEPALFGQFLVAALFIFFPTIDQLKRNWLFFGLIVGTAGLTQSVGTLFGIVCWAAFVAVYNYRAVLSLRRLDTKLLVLTVAVITIVAFSLISRLSWTDIFTLELGSSGDQRVTLEFATLAQVVDEELTGGGLLFGLGEYQAQTARSELVGTGDRGGGNGVVELTIRYGLFLLFLLWVTFTAMSGFMRGLFMCAIFALLTQIDSAVSQPFVWLYMAAIGLSLNGMQRRALGGFDPARNSRGNDGLRNPAQFSVARPESSAGRPARRRPAGPATKTALD